jgi:hypothetical protein
MLVIAGIHAYWHSDDGRLAAFEATKVTWR